MMATVCVLPGRYTRHTFDVSQFGSLLQSPAADAVIEVSANDILLDLSGVVLDGEGSGGVGISVHDCENVTIINGVIKGFHYGIHATNVTNLNVQGCVVPDNTNPLDTGWLPDTEEPVEEGFGGGVYLFQVSHSVIENNQVNNNFNGISLVRSDHNVIGGNHASYCGNVGIYLLKSSHNEVLHNLAEHCIRYTDRFWCDTADSAGILLEQDSNHNGIIGNSLRYSGDGFFIRGNRQHSSDNNFIKGNDGSFSPNNGFEAVFSDGNVFESNVANYCNYGFWLGYSSNTGVIDNEANFNRYDGTAIDSGRANYIQTNTIEGNRNGVRLWGKPWTERGTGEAVRSYSVSGNSISKSREQGISIEAGLDVTLEGNVLRDNKGDE